MNILVTLDRAYLPPLRVMLTSLLLNNPGERFHVFLLSDDLCADDLQRESALLKRAGSSLHPVHVEEDWFSDAPTLRYYSRAMYYRLLAAQLLPPELDRILYLDPDMLVINPIRSLYDTPLSSETLYAACIHEGLMNLPAIRRDVHPAEIFAYVERYRQLLILPDQDILNGLYGDRILPLPESLWNYDARRYREYRIASSGSMDMDYVMKHTAILHFCGKRKPWHKGNSGRFTALYKHYMQLTERLTAL